MLDVLACLCESVLVVVLCRRSPCGRLFLLRVSLLRIVVRQTCRFTPDTYYLGTDGLSRFGILSYLPANELFLGPGGPCFQGRPSLVVDEVKLRPRSSRTSSSAASPTNKASSSPCFLLDPRKIPSSEFEAPSYSSHRVVGRGRRTKRALGERAGQYGKMDRISLSQII